MTLRLPLHVSVFYVCLEFAHLLLDTRSTRLYNVHRILIAVEIKSKGKRCISTIVQDYKNYRGILRVSNTRREMKVHSGEARHCVRTSTCLYDCPANFNDRILSVPALISQIHHVW